ncbi:hypothetical protein KSP39_PZI024307 [Platanthera zijinensis]|uniref:Hyaluronan/mRNA-binding protein domain-containing protein n=1 Tax=Platanthera zijinensis TaxID=2320716 RepID=A0AAP0AS17_9ASPA
MATTNPFDILLDNENDDISLLISAQQKKLASNKTTSPPEAASTPVAAKLPSKPLPPSQAVRESRSNTGQTREVTGRGRGGRGNGAEHNTDFENGNYNRYGGGRGGFATENGNGAIPSVRGRGSSGQYRGSVRGGRRGGYVGGSGENEFDSERPQRRVYERRSGTGAGYEMKREGAGRGNWGTVTDEILAQETKENVNPDEKMVTPEKQVEHADGQGSNGTKDKEDAANDVEKESEDNEMTLEEYEKIREEKRKALLSTKPEERKVEIDEDFHSMQQLTVKKENNPIFIKLGSGKDSPKLRDNAEREERSRKAMSINEFLKPAKGDKYYSPGGRGRGRGDRDRGSFRGGFAGTASSLTVPAIEDRGQFPTLCAK